MANVRKSRGQAVGIFLLMLMAAMFMYMGVVMYFGIEPFFYTRAEQLNAPHFVTLKSPHATSDAQLEFIENFPGVYSTESHGVLVGRGSYYVGDTPTTGIIIFADGTVNQDMNPPMLIGDYLPFDGDAVYVFHTMLADGSHEIGESVSLYFMGQEFPFTIAGSAEDIFFSNTAMAEAWRFYITSEQFEEIREEFPFNYFEMISASLENIDDAVLLFAEYRNEFLGTQYHIAPFARAFPRTFQIARDSSTLIPMLVALFFSVFSLILLAVGVVVIHFCISNSIEENLKNIGTQKAMGYRNNQIILSILLQFGMIVLVSGLLGVALSQVVLPIIAGILEPTLGLPWTPEFELGTAIVSFTAIVVTVVAFSLLSSWRINKLYPIAALSGNTTEHKFKTNPLPFEKSRGTLTSTLAAKQIFQNKTQSVMICLIVAAVTFASVAGITLYYNANVNLDGFVRVLSGEVPDFGVVLEDSDDGSDFEERIRARPEVSSVVGNEVITLSVGDVAKRIWIVDDFNSITGASLVEGQFPGNDSEIVLGAVSLDLLGKGIGDRVIARSGDYTHEFLITGIVQNVARGFDPLMGMINTDGLHHIQPDFAFVEYWIYLEYGADIDDFEYMLNSYEDDVIATITNMQNQIDAQIGVIGDTFAIVTVIILAVVAAVVVLVLYLVIKATILRRRRDLGIQKALGFTTLQLMNQIAISLTPAIFIGVAVGAVGAYLGFNPLFVAFMSNMGVVRADMPTPLNWAIPICLFLIFLSYVVSMLIAGRIRKISAYALVIER